MICGQKMKEINKSRLLRKSSPSDIRITMRYPTTLDMIRCGGIFCMWDIKYYVLDFYIQVAFHRMNAFYTTRYNLTRGHRHNLTHTGVYI